MARTRSRCSPSGTSFAGPNFKRLRELLREPVLFDGRNVWEPNEVRALGFHY